MVTKKHPTTKSRKVSAPKISRSLNTKSQFIRAGVFLSIAAILIVAFLIYNTLTPKSETASSASQLITNLQNTAAINDQPQTSSQTGASIERKKDGEVLISAKEKTILWMATVSENSYEATKSSINKYFTDRSYTKHENGPSGAGVSVNYDGDRYSCRVDDWGASLNGVTKTQERTLLIACASADDFKVGN